MAKKNHFTFALIAMVAIVAIVGIVVLCLNFSVNYTTTDYTAIVEESAALEESQIGAAAARLAACTDSDGGKNYYAWGYVTYNKINYNDYCNGSAILSERYCYVNSKKKLVMGTEAYVCPYGCNNGACVNQTTTCTDSDGGKNYYVKGECIVSTISSGGGGGGGGAGAVSDLCTTTQLLKECYCENNNLKSTNFSCTYGCNDGACTTTPPCYDSDGGRDYYVRGITTGMTPAGYFTNGTDYCVDSSILEEYYCYNNLVYDYRFTCPSGYSCNNGACTSTAIRETDTCVFIPYYNQTNYCYSSKGNCTGYDSCTVGVIGVSGERVTWASNCYGNPASTIDGVNEYLYFNCTIMR